MPRWVLPIILVTGCAFSVQGPSPDRPRNEIPKCDTGKGLVALAGVIALSLVANDLDAAALVPLGVGALYVAGAIHGSRAADACRAEIDNFESSLAARDTMRLTDDNEQPRPRPAVIDSQPRPPIPVVQPPPPPQPQPQRVPAPPPQPPPQKPAVKPAPKSGDDWSDFWREVE